MYTFLLASLAFSYFYLRSSNNGLLWRPDHVTAPTAYGWTIYTLTLLAALMAIFGQSRTAKNMLSDWQTRVGRRRGITARPVPADLEFTAVPFYPGSSGYASTFIGYSVMNIITILIVAYWLKRPSRFASVEEGTERVSPQVSMHPSAQSFRATFAS